MKKLLIYLGIILSILFLWLALKDVVFSEVIHAFANARLVMLLPLLLGFFCFYWLRAIRWSAILSPKHKVPASSLVPSMMAGAAGNNLLPAHFGEFVRVYYSAKQFNIAKATMLASLMVERLMDLLAVLAIFSIAILAGEYSEGMMAAGTALLVMVVIAAGTCSLIVIYIDSCANFIRNRLSRPSLPTRIRIADNLIHLAGGLLALRELNLYLKIIVNSLMQWILIATCIYVSFLALNIEASIWLAVIILSMIIVGLTLPTAPGFFGTIEYCFVLGLTTVGIDPSVAISAGIFYHIPQWLAVTTVGLVIANYNSFSFTKIDSTEN